MGGQASALRLAYPGERWALNVLLAAAFATPSGSLRMMPYDLARPKRS
jgi:hypothetical protein